MLETTPNYTENSDRIPRKVNNVNDKVTNESNLCGADNEWNNGKCLNLAGFRTNHPGYGRCFWHDKITTVKVKNSDILLRIPALEERMQELISDDKLLSVDSEIALLRSYLELYSFYIQVLKDENLAKTVPELSKLNVSQISEIIIKTTGQIGKLVKIKNDLEQSRKYVVHINIFANIIGMMANIINDEVVDLEIKRAILNKFATINLPSPEV